MLEQVNNLRALLGRVSEGGGATAQQRHVSRGKLLVRERIDTLRVRVCSGAGCCGLSRGRGVL